MSAEPTLNDLLRNLANAVDEYRKASSKAMDWHAARLNALDDDMAALRDDTHEALTALGNRIESATRTPFQ